MGFWLFLGPNYAEKDLHDTTGSRRSQMRNSIKTQVQRDINTAVKQAWTCYPERPEQQYKKCIEVDTGQWKEKMRQATKNLEENDRGWNENNGTTWNEVRKIATDREEWKSLVSGLCATQAWGGSCHVISFHVVSCHFMSCYIMLCQVVMSCHIMSCHIMSCFVMSRNWLHWSRPTPHYLWRRRSTLKTSGLTQFIGTKLLSV